MKPYGMNNSSAEGLGISVLVYMAAMIGGLMLVALPVYYANTPTVIENVTPAQFSGTLTSPRYEDRTPGTFPLVMLKQEQLVDPKVVAELNADVKQTAPQPAAGRTAHDVTQDRRERVASRPSFNPFGLFSLF